MKQYVLTLIFLISSLCIFSQQSKGTIQFGIGGLPILYPDHTLPTGYSLKANAGYFVMDGLAVGVSPFSGKVDEISSLGASLYLRYYVNNSRASFFVEGGVGYGKLKYKLNPQVNGTLNVLNIGPGVHFTIKGKLALEVLVQYANLKNISFPEWTIDGHTIIPTLGFQYFLNR